MCESLLSSLRVFSERHRDNEHIVESGVSFFFFVFEKRSKTTLIKHRRSWMRDFDHVIIVAGAGMSAFPAELRQNVYISEEDFKYRYPHVKKYKTSYEAMSLFFDPEIDLNTKWGYQAQHMDNMSSKFKPNMAYTYLRKFVEKKKSYSVLTSNVDACFTRSGFDPKRVYTPQGEWTYYQCMKRCTEHSVWPSREMLDKILPSIKNGVLKSEVPRCKVCNSKWTFGNVRGGDWFIHSPYEASQKRFVKWAEERVRSKTDRVVVIEIGAGFNTPTVTRYPCESFVRELGNRGALIRINPTDPMVPRDLKNAVGLKCGWKVLEVLCSSQHDEKEKKLDAKAASELVVSRSKSAESCDEEERWKFLRSRWGHFDWRVFMENLRH